MRGIKLFTCMVIIVSGLFTFIGCSSDKPSDTIYKFESAYNNADVNGMLDCIDPTVSRGIRAGLNLVSSLIKVNPNDILELFPLIYRMAGDLDPSFGDKKPQLQIKVLDTSITENQAVVEVNLILIAGNEREEAGAYFLMIKEGKKWYIKDIDDK